MGVNKVMFAGESIMDISDSTVTPDKLAKGEIAYGADGERIVGTLVASGGGGTGGSNVATCSVKVAATRDSVVIGAAYTEVFDGALTMAYKNETLSTAGDVANFSDVACGTLFGVSPEVWGGENHVVTEAICVGCYLEFFSDGVITVTLDGVPDGGTAEVMLVYG